jgi:hypothetical protein
MDAREFDDLVTRITSQASRRTALGIAGGALTSAGLVVAAVARRKKRGHGRNADRHAKVSALGKKGKKRKVCICASYEMLECETRKVKKKKARQLVENNPGSYQGECAPLTKRLPGRDR